jgi:hypothetical protein
MQALGMQGHRLLVVERDTAVVERDTAVVERDTAVVGRDTAIITSSLRSIIK